MKNGDWLDVDVKDWLNFIRMGHGKYNEDTIKDRNILPYNQLYHPTNEITS